ncbi:hydroxymethylglutaryl-CoA lyase [Paraburkholderia lycopersici]|uniref:Hydroxymethylglutaryl-CoA lyase n=1 Tax=Paraburkholderia lycopersici TaxID=416944 RepID=A0A1G7A2P6_9BURK|nr:hydroxymethylglutaryl-CoA lyase [Paraburkholderia lycopersici]SDE08325.1 hydroxymethylglutaryl-CoA lyase [Paraburkholderia lycopersici]
MKPWSGDGRPIFINEVGPRDGFQVESAFVPTDEKVGLINALSEAGLSKIEVTAFVSPKAIPALRDAEVVLNEIQRNPDVVYTALVPNVRGAERAIESRADELNLVMSASDSHNLSNLRMTREQSFSGLMQVAGVADASEVRVNISLSCAFGCPMEGDVPEDTVFHWCERFIEEAGANGVTLCDTTGMAYPSQVARMTEAFIARWPKTELTLHFHNTRGMGLANIIAAIDSGVTRFDASFGGLGGCPYAPGASGNVCTEEVVHALELMGYRTSINLDALMGVSRRLPSLVGHDLPSQLLKAGKRLDLHAPPPDFAEIRERALARNMPS